MKTIKERFWEKVDKTDTCWNWTASKRGKVYGGFQYKGKLRLAHRVVYEMYRGVIPVGLEIDHLCNNTICVNPDHLEVVTPRENTLRSNNPTAINARKTSCIHNHPLSGDNLYTHPNGGRGCRACSSRSYKQWAKRNKK